MTQHLNQQHFSPQAFSTYDPAVSIYYRTMTAKPGHHGYHHQQQLKNHCVSGNIQPQHQEQARRLQQLQQDAILQQQEAMYHQQMMACQQQQQQHYQMIQPPSPGRRMQTKADRRAEHNAVERLRRENLNSKFQQLAHTLPNLQNDRRPSKGTIIERTLDFVKNTMQKEEKLLSEVRKLREEYDHLMQQLYPGQNHSATPSMFSDDDNLSSSGGVSPVSDLRSQKTSSCPSLELPSEESPELPPTTGLGAAGLFESYALTINPWDDMRFGHYDNSITSPDDLDLTSATITTALPGFLCADDPPFLLAPYADILTTPGKYAMIPSVEYGFKIQASCLDH